MSAPKKYELVVEALRAQIPQMLQSMDYHFPTEQQLCEQFSVSRQTVRRALEVLKAQRLIRARQGSGMMLTGLEPEEGRNRVDVLIGSDSEYIFPALLRDLQRNLTAQGYHLRIHTTGDDLQRERRILEALLQDPPRGLIAQCCQGSLPNPSLDLYQALAQDGTRLLFLFGAYPNFPAYACVKDDNVRGGYDITAHLIHRGHTHIAGIFQRDAVQGPERYFGALSALRDHGLDLSIHTGWFDHRQLAQLQRYHRHAFLSEFVAGIPQGVTAVVCYNDEIAYWLLKELSAAGIRVPEDLSIVSFDNSYLQHTGPFRVTTLTHETREAADRTSHLMGELLLGEEPRTILLPWRILEGASVRTLTGSEGG